jgi:hypothetical protein
VGGARPVRRTVALTAVSVALAQGASAAPPAVEAAAQPVGLSQLCVTNGEIEASPDGWLSIQTPSSRAFVRAGGGQAPEIRFPYLGPSAASKPLASGEMRRQIGLKLHAQDTCNLVYAMWHIEPDTKVWVLVKRNPGESTHAQCGAHGYVRIRPRKSVEPPPLRPGEEHSLRAELRGDELTVRADGRVVWEGALGGQAADIDGPVGLRTDNAAFQFQYYALRGTGTESAPTPDRAPARCEKGPGD